MEIPEIRSLIDGEAARLAAQRLNAQARAAAEQAEVRSAAQIAEWQRWQIQTRNEDLLHMGGVIAAAAMNRQLPQDAFNRRWFGEPIGWFADVYTEHVVAGAASHHGDTTTWYEQQLRGLVLQPDGRLLRVVGGTVHESAELGERQKQALNRSSFFVERAPLRVKTQEEFQTAARRLAGFVLRNSLKI